MVGGSTTPTSVRLRLLLTKKPPAPSVKVWLGRIPQRADVGRVAVQAGFGTSPSNNARQAPRLTRQWRLITLGNCARTWRALSVTRSAAAITLRSRPTLAG